MPDCVIEFLPDHVRVIPAAPFSGTDPDADAKRARYMQWRDDVYRWRVEHRYHVDQSPELQALELYRCTQDYAYWLVTYGTIFEPREDRNALGGGNLPFIPFAKQVDLARFLLGTLTQKGPDADAVVSKTRDVGASWIVCSLALWGWLFRNPWNALLISRKEDLVDSKNARSLFAKIDRLFWGLPEWMKPKKFDPDRHRQKLFLYNPDNLNEIGGESTTSKTGRGDRATWAAFDEAAFIPELFNTWNGISSTTSHRWAVSTENLDDGPDFYNLRTGNDMEYRPALFEMDWWDNPLNGLDYFENERKRMASRPADFEREILRNPHAGNSTWVYGQFWDPKFEPDPQYNEPSKAAPTYVTMDPGKLDSTAIVILQEDTSNGNTVILDSYQNSGMDADFYGTLLSATPDEEKYPGQYGEREHAFMGLVRAIPAPTYCGDVYGDTSNGATLDTFYSVLLRYDNPQGERITVNRDRLGNKDRGMYAKSRNTFKGRQQCVHELSQGFRFASRPGAVFAHKCVKNHRFKPLDKPVMAEPSAALHDWTSHVMQAIEFWAVYKKTRTDIMKSLVSDKPKKAQQAKGAGVRLATLGSQKQRSRLYTSR